MQIKNEKVRERGKRRKRRKSKEKGDWLKKQGLAALGHQRIVKRLNRRIKEAHEIKRKQIEEDSYDANDKITSQTYDKVEAEVVAFKENRRHSDIARETKERLRRHKMRAAKVVEDEKQYQRDKLRLYQMHRTYLEEVGASVGATVVSPVRVPRR